ncbi:MAG TPA: hypothetical protein ACFCUY_03810 [Xenococcaceae cyanobacterium]
MVVVLSLLTINFFSISTKAEIESLEAIEPKQGFDWNLLNESESTTNETDSAEVSISEFNLTEETEPETILEPSEEWGNQGDVEDRSFSWDFYKH